MSIYKMEIPFLDLSRSHGYLKSEFEAEISKVIENSYFVLGKKVSDFEDAFALYCNSKHGIGVGNGLDALIISLKALNIKKGDEVLVPSNTYIATWLAVSAIEGTCVPVEPDIDTYNIDASKIEEKITAKTKAIIPVHLYGQPCEMDKILAVCKKHSLKIVEDNAQAQGATFNGITTGNFGDINATSLYPGKNLGALGDAGIITTNNTDLAAKAKLIRNYGSDKKYHNEIIGMNSRLDEIHAAVLCIKLKELDKWNKDRTRIANYYLENLNNVGDLKLPKTINNANHVYHQFVIRTNHRDQLQTYLSEKGIGNLIHYPIPPHLQKAYAFLNFKMGDFPIAEKIAKECLSLPCFPFLTIAEQAYICTCLKDFYSNI